MSSVVSQHGAPGASLCGVYMFNPDLCGQTGNSGNRGGTFQCGCVIKCPPVQGETWLRSKPATVCKEKWKSMYLP